MKTGRSARLRKFGARTTAGEEVTDYLGTQYVAVHPFADDTSLLKELSWTSEQCVEVDAYWLALGDVVFVQVISSAQEGWRPVGKYFRYNPNSHYVNLVAVVAEKIVTRSVFEYELKGFLEQGILTSALKQESKLGPVLVAALMPGDSSKS